MSLEADRKIPFEEINHPVPGRNRVLSCRGVWEFPLSADPGYAEFKNWPSFITRYIVGRNYSGPQLPPGTREVLHVILLDNINPAEEVKHIVSYVDVEYHTTPHGVWDRFMGYHKNGYYAVFQENGNIGRFVFQEGYGIVRTRGDKLEEAKEYEPAELRRHIPRPQGTILLAPSFRPIQSKELPVTEEAYEAKKAELINIFQS